MTCALVLQACGESGEPAPENEKDRVARAVNSFAAAAVAGDGEAACAYLSERAQRLMFRQAPASAASCAELFEEAGGDATVDDDVPTFTSDDVRLDRFRGSPSATVSDPYGGQMLLLKTDDDWLIEIPGFVK
jgi:hypothetical protein